MAKEVRSKALVVFYCSTTKQAKDWKEGNLEKRIKAHFTQLNNHYEITIEYEMLRFE